MYTYVCVYIYIYIYIYTRKYNPPARAGEVLLRHAGHPEDDALEQGSAGGRKKGYLAQTGT